MDQKTQSQMDICIKIVLMAWLCNAAAIKYIKDNTIPSYIGFANSGHLYNRKRSWFGSCVPPRTAMDTQQTAMVGVIIPPSLD